MTALDHGIPVVTAQRTQTRFLRYAYAKCKQNTDVSAWPTPNLFTWSDWVSKLADDIMWSGYLSPAGQRKLLSPGQEQLIWEQVIAQHSGAVSLDNLSGTASRARQAWDLIQAWRLPDPKTAEYPTRDVQLFSAWMREYYSKTVNRHWLDQARLTDSVAPAVRAGAIVVPQQIMLVGFNGFTPQQRVLLKNLEDSGTKFNAVKQRPVSANIKRVPFSDHQHEIEAAARWVRKRLTDENAGVAAVLIPDLDRKIHMVQRIFDDVLSPGSALPSSSLVGRPYSTSFDQPYRSYKLVEGALLILRVALTPATFANASSFLRSQFIRAAGAEQPMRARFELWLRHNNVDTVSPGELLKLLEVFAQRQDPDAVQSVLSSALSGLKPLIAKSHAQHPTSYWSTLFKDVLNVAGWPGDAQPTVVESQVADKLRDVLNELSAIEFLAPVCNVDGALSYLNRIIRGTHFRPSVPETNVQIMQPEEAYGLRFDAVWVAGWHNQNWPSSSRANPFLPIAWQRANEIPGSSSELQLQHAVTVTNDLCGAACDVIFSHPLSSNEEELGESPLVMKVPGELSNHVEIDEQTNYCEQIQAATDLIQLTDYSGPNLADVNCSKGGSTIFRLQSQCAFKAFAELRLGVQPWVVPRPGVSALEKGNHLHKALEFLWAQISDSSMLAELSSTEHLENQVYREVEMAINYQDRKRVRKLSGAVRNLEQQRLVRQIMDILAMEIERPPFEVVGHEVQHKMQLGPLIIDGRIDRVDHVIGHGQLLIDYKLGLRTANVWKLPRMEEPQLPLYTTAYDEPVKGIAFINGKRGSIGLQGVAAESGMAANIKAIEKSILKSDGHDWPAQLAAWKSALEGLAIDYVSGKANVNPISSLTCAHCDLKSLCRVNLRQFQGMS